MTRPTLPLLCVFALLLAACGEPAKNITTIANDLAAMDAEVGTVTTIDCPLKLPGEEEGVTYSCGVYTAPLDYANPAGPKLNLAFTMLRSASANPLPDPIVYLAGGPGQSGVVSANGSLYGDLRQERDLIFPAQRGTLFAHRLALDECVALLGEQMSDSELNAFVESVSGRERLDRSLPFDTYLAQYSEQAGAINARCHAAFTAAGLNPAAFTTANSANDLVGLLVALGYDSFNLHGVSYGTRLALELVRRHPQAGVRSVVLDSPVAPTVDRLVRLANATHDSVLRLFDNCAEEPACNAAYPNLVERTNALIDQLNTQPIASAGKTIGSAEFITQLTDLSGTRAGFIPRMIAELEQGDPTTYLALLNGDVGLSSAAVAASPAVQQFIQQISSAAGAKAGLDVMAALEILTDILRAAQETGPKAAMKAVAEEKLAGSAELPNILERIDNLTPEEIEELATAVGAPQATVDEDQVARVTDAQAKNNALFLLSGIVCHEQLDRADVGAALTANRTLAIPALRASESRLATEVGNCTNYPMGDANPTYHDAIASDIPILILQGEFDVRTPPINGRTLAEQLANATLVLVPQAGHETWTSNPCVAQIGSSFFKDPLRIPDQACLEQRRIRFLLPTEPLKGE